GKRTATCEVTVSSKAVGIDEIEFNNSNEWANKGDSYYVEYSVYPSGATDRELSWKSSDPSVVSVSDDGYVQCLKEGMAVITASKPGSSKIKATVEIYVE
ncbi:MAG: Ig-like domain-containing protein, partial [Oscillospiraceae bacterium]|nr:Ig-like domain-containing protein [Oscillospiraceae bacterium]